MQKRCPKCEAALAPIARGAYKCSACAGMFLPAALVPLIEEDASATPAESHDAVGGQCPDDRTILTRAEIDLGPDRPPVHLERCSSCRGIWFDHGEWSLLAERELLERIGEFWTVEWRTRQRRERNAREYERRVREELGPELHDALQAVAAKLKGHERRSQALAFLREASAD